jgi:GTP-binding protein EngB required for normal cell division
MLQYSQAKEDLSSIIERLTGSVRDDAVRSLETVKAKIEEEAFNLVILGQFKRGKSTFINALLGEDLLPTAIVPLTSVVTILRYGPELKIEVRFLDDRHEEVVLADLPIYITERGNPQNNKGVKEVTVFYPSEYLRGGVRIIDTPGVGSVYLHNTDVAYNYLPFVDAGVFIFSADPPLSESEHQFLQNIRAYVDKLFFVLNKMDQVSEEDRRESLDFTARILEQDLGTGRVQIYPLSARWALEGKKAGGDVRLKDSLLPDFEEQLQNFLMHEKGKVFLTAVANSLLKLVSDETMSFQLEREAIKLPLQELTARIARFEEEMKAIGKDREQNQYLLKGHLGKMLVQLDEEIAAFKKKTLPVLLGELEVEYLRQVERGGGNLRKNLEQFVFNRLKETFNGWRQSYTDTISAQLEGAHREFAIKINETIERITAITSSIFELQLKPFTSVEVLARKSEFYFLFKDDPVGLELIQLAVSTALPQFVAKKMILKNMRTAVTELLDRHCGRVRYDLVKRLTKTVEDFQRALNGKIDETLDGIRISFQKALVLNQSSKVNVEKNLTELAARLESISEIRDVLLACAAAISQMR